MSNRHPRRRNKIKPFPMTSRDVICAQCGKATNRKKTKAIDRGEGKATPSRVCRPACEKS